jgi:hypothetical protein
MVVNYVKINNKHEGDEKCIKHKICVTANGSGKIKRG